MVAVRLALTGYIIPFMFVFGPSLLMIGHWTTVVITAITAFAGVALLSIGLQGYLFGRMTWVPRLLFIAAAFTLIKPGVVTDVAGISLAAAGIVVDYLYRRAAGPSIEPEAAERAEMPSGGK